MEIQVFFKKYQKNSSVFCFVFCEGLSCAKIALKKGKSVVFADKGPLVLEFENLFNLAKLKKNVKIEYSATVCGGLPVVNILRRDLKAINGV